LKYYNDNEEYLEKDGLPKITLRLQKLIKNNYHKIKVTRVRESEEVLNNLIEFYNTLSTPSDKQKADYKFLLKNQGKKKIHNYISKMDVSGHMDIEDRISILPKILSQRVSQSNPKVLAKPGEPYFVKITKELREVLPIKPGLDCKFLGISPFNPGKIPQKIRRIDKLGINTLKLLKNSNDMELRKVSEDFERRVVISGSWESQQKEFQIFCDHVEEKYSAEEIFDRVSKSFHKLRLPKLPSVEAIDVLHVETNPNGSVGFFPECMYGRGVKHQQVDHHIKFPAYMILKKAKSKVMADRTFWTIGGRSRAQKIEPGKDLRSRLLIVPDGVTKIVGLAACNTIYHSMSVINKNRSDNEICTGIDFMNGHYDKFINHMNKYEYCIEADMKRFDQHVGRNVLKVAWSILRSCYPEGEEMDNLFLYYSSGFINKNIVIPHGLIYRVRKSVATGSPFTSIIGTIVNWINWTLVMDDLRIPPNEYHIKVYGDDTLIYFNTLYNLDLDIIKDKLYTLTGQTADPLIFKKIKNNYYEDRKSIPTFLKTYSFFGLPSRHAEDFLEKIIYPESYTTSLYQRSERLAQQFYNPCFSPDALFLLITCYRAVIRQMYLPFRKRLAKGKISKQYSCYNEFYEMSDNKILSIIYNTFLKYVPPFSLRDTWSNFNFETYKDKYISPIVLAPKDFNINISQYYNIDYIHCVSTLKFDIQRWNLIG